MKLFPTKSLKDIDAYTIEHEPIASIDLMERAAVALTDAICRQYSDTNTPVVVFAGPGNNGGDALAVARLMANQGYRPEVYLFNVKGTLSPDCQTNADRLQATRGARLVEVSAQFTPPMLTSDHIVLDGLFGSGLNKPLSGGFAAVVRYINSSPATVIAIDIPSGLMGEDNTFNQPDHIVRADLTLTIGLPKLAFFFAENQPYVGGEWKTLDIGLSEEAIEQTPTDYRVVETDDIVSLIHPRAKFAHKGNFGHALLVAGSMGMAGASVLAAKACLKSGVGRLTVHVPLCNNFIVQTAVPEAMTHIDPNETCFASAQDTEGCQAVGIGPGLGQAEATQRALADQIERTRVPMVVDADALNIISQRPGLLRRLPAGSILTPHPKELDRLVGDCRNSYERLERARRLAQEARVHIVVKGAHTAVVSPEGKVSLNTTGNPGMATAGSGDVLTGVILALLAQGYKADDAATMGVYVHGLAGDIAARRIGMTGMTAGDIVAALPMAWKALEEEQA